MSQGHPDARLYPLGMLTDEVGLAVERVNRDTVTQANLVQAAIMSIVAKKGGEIYGKLVSELNVKTELLNDETSGEEG